MAEPTRVDERWLSAAIELYRLCPPTDAAYSIGTIIVSVDGEELSRGYSRDDAPLLHAEESALAKMAGTAADLTGATMYTSMEPCTTRRSRPRACTNLIIAAGIRRVVLALREPPVFARCFGVETLHAADVQVVTIPELGAEVAAVNAAVLQQ
jgi:diaminohydroxyphosphoribosylaminopyrimidine deaminase/5-amino-6-(5-phosphoribosylamino)uracil reductase